VVAVAGEEPATAHYWGRDHGHPDSVVDGLTGVDLEEHVQMDERGQFYPEVDDSATANALKTEAAIADLPLVTVDAYAQDG
jgi:hypothetical protein